MSTGILVGLAGLGVAVLRAVGTSLLAGEVKAMFTAYLEHRVRKAARHLPVGLAADQEDEWLAEIAALDDRPLRAFLFVRGLRRAASSISNAHRSDDVAETEFNRIALFWGVVFGADEPIWFAWWIAGWWLPRGRRHKTAEWLRAAASVMSPAAREWALRRADEIEPRPRQRLYR
jgi:hypothetical protein